MKQTQSAPCRCCGGKTVLFDEAAIMGKYPVGYYRCEVCGFIQTEEPFWLAESYANPMTSYDLGGISRPTLNTRVTRAVLNTCFSPGGQCLDFGGGYGVFTRWMRDLGYDFWHHDKHCANLFANGFQADISGAVHYELATAFEVFEHLPEPVPLIESIFKVTDSILFTTDLIPSNVTKIEDWLYFGPEHGQHVSFYTPESLHRLASCFNARYLQGHQGFHLITRTDITQQRFQLVLGPRVREIVNFVCRRDSLLSQDFHAAVARARETIRAQAISR